MPILAAALLTACRPISISFKLYTPTPTPTPVPTPPVVRAFTQFSAGDTLDLVRIQLGLDNYEVRYRTTMPEGEMGMIYFLDDGNLHIDAKKVGNTWVILSVPLLDPSPIPAADRAAEWDRAADSQVIKSRSDR